MPQTDSTLSQVLSLRDEEVNEFLREAIMNKRLSAVMESLNAELLNGAPERKTQAGEAINRLGFIA